MSRDTKQIYSSIAKQIFFDSSLNICMDPIASEEYGLPPPILSVIRK